MLFRSRRFGQLVALATEFVDLGQPPDTLRQLCRNELFSRDQYKEDSRKLTGQLVPAPILLA